ncbi:hypothetical protein CDL60_10895 [Roseateles noduli]|nr:hypothetical protein CDL60_10895 [Roseateles noduli]
MPDVGQVSPYLAEHIRGNVEAYGVTLAPLPAAAWETSVCAWQGEHWGAPIDLWSVEEGAIDLVLEIHVREIGDRFVFHVHMVYVP